MIIKTDEIDKNCTVPIFQQIANIIIKNIDDETLIPGTKLPTERELSEIFQVSRGTIKNCYKHLEKNKIIETIQGSGSYVLKDKGLSFRMEKKAALTLMETAVYNLKKLGISNSTMFTLLDICLHRQSQNTLLVAIIYDNQEVLLDFKKQLSYLPDVILSIFIVESITTDQNPERLMVSFDIIITPSEYYSTLIKILPNLEDKIIQAAVSPSNQTLIEITVLPRTSRIGIICRTNVFLSIVKETLLSYNFLEENISSYFEMDYTVSTYFSGGIDALISFSDAHIFTDPNFSRRNKELIDKGGKIIEFKYEIEKGTLIFIEDRVKNLMAEKIKP